MIEQGEAVDETLTIDQYLAAERARLDKFEAQWRRGMQDKPDYFPETMEHGGWFEAYTAFDEDSDMVASAPDEPGR